MATAQPTPDLAAALAQVATLLAQQQQAEPEPNPPAQPTPSRVLLTVEEAAEQLNIGRTKTYALVRNGDIESVQIGRLRRVPKTALENYAAQLINEQKDAA